MFTPKKFGKYLLIDKIAAGGLAELFQSRVSGAQGFEKLIAIKTILPHLAQENELVNCFIDEAKLAALLNHQNIVQIYDFGDIDGTFFIAMQYLVGKDLRRVLDKAKEKNIFFDLGYSLYITSLICSGLDYAHNLKDLQGRPLELIHRDVTPQNIIITYDGDVKIVDFGIAKAAARSTLTQIGTIKGKVAHMSPEQASGQSIDSRSDIFSTGIILYELITGQKMFQGDTMEILAKVRDCNFKLPESIVSDLPQKVYSILHRSLAKDPDRRYQTCGEMQADLEECIHELALWPTSRGLSKIMNSIYENEIIAEGKALRKTATIIINGRNQEGTEIDYQGTVGEIIFENVDKDDTTKLHNYDDIDDTENLNDSVTKLIQRHEGSKAPAFMYASIIILALASIISIFIYMPNMTERQESHLPQTEVAIPLNSNSLNSSGDPAPITAESSLNKKQVLTVNNLKSKKLSKTETPVKDKDSSTLESKTDPLENTNSLYGSIVITKKIPKKSNVETILEVKKACLALNANKYKEATALFERAIANHPALSTEITRFYAFSFREKGIYLQNSNIKQAKVYLTKAVKIEPSNPRNYFQLGLLFIRLKDFSAAIEEYKKALNLEFSSPTIYFNMGYAYTKLGEYEDAKNMFIKAINLNPPYKNEALFNLAVVQNLQGDNKEAVKNLRKILQANSNNKKAKLLLSKIEKEVG
ncbi:MAG: protein kinase [Desulfobacteraceae bacterium]|nr:protein kinase [Desulfobacteraceae bacterium]